ncbi:2-dehydro-3-deoxy-D-gluconate 5-dehydrogenase KduD [Anaerobacillus sp. CMMVII]|uniref:2-dehydro-3-deoxy-D-gluconate 5-dehydrogenase KduD n=1 Tax=Anaerobacillus sp. CMMVII TaxID=2755588 RepID=UPI0021B76EA4|nr:2-dehydro-3-deoxy-D-gluconate 5-dehydrogenase KduD [Anaerobacillus sp. CMMVII]MCT8139257.1 2-dehydro-3-deoxy-D-gluconate 5-dehydrogenase KduD [Anaerobacillus sp. CMMVII]
MSNLFSLEGRTALVTGAGRGIGQAIAIAFAEAGADLVLVGSSPMEETEKRIAELGRTSTSYLVDLLDVPNITQSFQKIVSENTIDIVLNNAGIIRREPAIEHTLENWQSVIDINLSAVFIVSQQVAKQMLERGSGKIINIASLLSFQGGITVPGYAASKHGVAGITKAFANEWANKGVQINAIAPGYISTANTAALREDEARSTAILERIPAGRWGQVSDLVGAAVFLASTASDYVNGHVLVVDGGWMSR